MAQPLPDPAQCATNLGAFAGRFDPLVNNASGKCKIDFGLRAAGDGNPEVLPTFAIFT